MEFIDYYKVLGLSNGSSADEIKKAYRKLARKFHPDLNPDDAEAQRRFQEINEAHEVLSDPEKRKKYDKYGKDWKHADAYEQAGGGAGFSGFRRDEGTGGYEGFSESFGGSGFSDFFEHLFGGAYGGDSGRVRFKGQDLKATVQLSLRDAFASHKRTLDLNGKKIRITIHEGVEDGQTIKINGYGQPGMNGGPPGDLYLTFQVIPDTNFKRVGKNLYKEVPVDLYTAVLGGEITVDTMDTKVKLKVKPGTQNGSKVKLKGKGFPAYKGKGEHGDLYLTYRVNIPTSLSEKEKALFEELAKSKR